MNSYQHLFSALILICTPLGAYLTKLSIDHTLLHMGFRDDNQIVRKRIQRHHKAFPYLERLLMFSFIKNSDQNRVIVWIYAIWWWLVLLVTLIETVLGILGLFIPDLLNIKIVTICFFVSAWFPGIAISFDSYLVPEHRKDPGISSFECGFIAFGILLGGLGFIVLYTLGLW